MLILKKESQNLKRPNLKILFKFGAEPRKTVSDQNKPKEDQNNILYMTSVSTSVRIVQL